VGHRCRRSASSVPLPPAESFPVVRTCRLRVRPVPVVRSGGSGVVPFRSSPVFRWSARVVVPFVNRCRERTFRRCQFLLPVVPASAGSPGAGVDPLCPPLCGSRGPVSQCVPIAFRWWRSSSAVREDHGRPRRSTPVIAAASLPSASQIIKPTFA